MFDTPLFNALGPVEPLARLLNFISFYSAQTANGRPIAFLICRQPTTPYVEGLSLRYWSATMPLAYPNGYHLCHHPFYH
jgi:hypothetical protein